MHENTDIKTDFPIGSIHTRYTQYNNKHTQTSKHKKKFGENGFVLFCLAICVFMCMQACLHMYDYFEHTLYSNAEAF